MKKFFGIFIDVFLITASICIAVILNNKFNIFISGVSVGIWIICLVLDIIELCYIPEYKTKRGNVIKRMENKVNTKIDCSNIKQVRIHKQQFDSIEKKADYLILSCIENGRCIGFKRENEKLIETYFIGNC